MGRPHGQPDDQAEAGSQREGEAGDHGQDEPGGEGARAWRMDAPGADAGVPGAGGVRVLRVREPAGRGAAAEAEPEDDGAHGAALGGGTGGGPETEAPPVLGGAVERIEARDRRGAALGG